MIYDFLWRYIQKTNVFFVFFGPPIFLFFYLSVCVSVCPRSLCHIIFITHTCHKPYLFHFHIIFFFISSFFWITVPRLCNLTIIYKILYIFNSSYHIDRGPVVKRVRPPREFSRPIYFVLGTSKEYKTTCYIHNKCSLHCFIAILPLFYNKKYIFCKFCCKSFNYSLKCVKKRFHLVCI